MEQSTDDAAPGGPFPTRPFGLADAMIVVGASAVGLALARGPAAFLSAKLPQLLDPYPPVHRTMLFLLYGSTAVYPMVIALTAGAIGLRLRRPRPTCLRLARQPGWIACLAAVLVFLIGLTRRIPVSIRSTGTTLDSFLFTEWIRASEECGYAVIGAWLTMGLLGRWRPEPSWIDRLGRALGVAWIGAVVLEIATAWAWLLGW